MSELFLYIDKLDFLNWGVQKCPQIDQCVKMPDNFHDVSKPKYLEKFRISKF